MVEFNVPATVRTITVYDRNEVKDGINYPAGDYRSVEVWFDLDLVVTFGDAYLDQGQVRAEAFVDGAYHVWKTLYGSESLPLMARVDRYPCVEKQNDTCTEED